MSVNYEKESKSRWDWHEGAGNSDDDEERERESVCVYEREREVYRDGETGEDVSLVNDTAQDTRRQRVRNYGEMPQKSSASGEDECHVA
jgi:hypothetical protein